MTNALVLIIISFLATTVPVSGLTADTPSSSNPYNIQVPLCPDGQPGITTQIQPERSDLLQPAIYSTDCSHLLLNATESSNPLPGPELSTSAPSLGEKPNGGNHRHQRRQEQICPADCSNECFSTGNKPNTNDCSNLVSSVSSQGSEFTVQGFAIVTLALNTCMFSLINDNASQFIYCYPSWTGIQTGSSSISYSVIATTLPDGSVLQSTLVPVPLPNVASANGGAANGSIPPQALVPAVVGGVFGVLSILFVLLFCLWKRRNKRMQRFEVQEAIMLDKKYDDSQDNVVEVGEQGGNPPGLHIVPVPFMHKSSGLRPVNAGPNEVGSPNELLTQATGPTPRISASAEGAAAAVSTTGGISKAQMAAEESRANRRRDNTYNQRHHHHHHHHQRNPSSNAVFSDPGINGSRPSFEDSMTASGLDSLISPSTFGGSTLPLYRSRSQRVRTAPIAEENETTSSSFGRSHRSRSRRHRHHYHRHHEHHPSSEHSQTDSVVGLPTTTSSSGRGAASYTANSLSRSGSMSARSLAQAAAPSLSEGDIDRLAASIVARMQGRDPAEYEMRVYGPERTNESVVSEDEREQEEPPPPWSAPYNPRSRGM
ncbi:hypothetical protein FRC19_003072 [Serendipita sp. 401]|nr:hypothetical protein FRC19_003072 [Serendipita sp. 401]